VAGQAGFEGVGAAGKRLRGSGHFGDSFRKRKWPRKREVS
jgi:hypothetical protein